MKATEIFTPGSFPAHTYVERSGEALERSLRDAIGTPGQAVSLVGPSTSGKTVLVEKVVGRDVLITITGAGIQNAERRGRFARRRGSCPAAHRSHSSGRISAARSATKAGPLTAPSYQPVAKGWFAAMGTVTRSNGFLKSIR
jgi:hypothetical protein